MTDATLRKGITKLACTLMLTLLLPPHMSTPPLRAAEPSPSDTIIKLAPSPRGSTQQEKLSPFGSLMADTFAADASPPAQSVASTPFTPILPTSHPASPDDQAEPLAKVEPLVLEELKASARTDFFVWMAEKADLQPAHQLKTKEEKGRFVFEALRETAERTQKGLREDLDGQGVDYRAFYIANKILVRGGNQMLLMNIASRPEVASITADHKFQLQEPIINPRARVHVLAVEPNISFVNADDVWNLGYDGAGTVLAGNDTGLDWDHPALINQYRGWDGTTADHNYNWWDATGTYRYIPNDGHGHGTHTTGTMVGYDGGANQIGMAPGAQTIHCKNMTDSGGGSDATFTECFEWDLAPWDLVGANPRPDLAPDAINNSWGYSGGNYPVFEDEIAALQAAGILVEASAANSGPGCATLGSPGDYRQVLTTGSVNHAGGDLPGTVTGFSSRGPSRLYPAEFIPDVMAPGENIRSSVPGGGYQGGWSGTSMSGPHVTGLVGLMWSANPALRGLVTPTVQIILDTAVPLTGQSGSDCGGDYIQGPNNDWGYGTIDALEATEQAMRYGGSGALAGTVTDGLSPLPDATIRATLSPTLSWHTTSDLLGNYSMRVFSGIYTVTTSLYGYYPDTAWGVSVISGTTTTLNIKLTRAETYVVSGTVSDANTGWPLYASIDIDNYPGGTIWTDPVSGFYSVTLVAGVTYIFNVEAWLPGYNATSRAIGPLTADATEDFALDVNAVTCTAPGYEQSLVELFFEEFEGGPGNWSMTGLWNLEGEADACGTTVAPFPSPSMAAYYGIDGVCTYDTGSANSGELTMTAPVALPTSDGAILSFWSYEKTECDGNCIYDHRLIEVSTDGGMTWTTLGEGDQENSWYQKTFDLTPYLGSHSLIRFRFDAVDAIGNSYFGWMLDDVSISKTLCAPSPGGLVVGNIHDANTNAPLVGAGVANDSGEATAAKVTPLDPAVDDAFYTLFSAAGTHPFTATMKGGYETVAQTIPVVESNTTRLDFNLPAGWLTYAPPSLEATLTMGTGTTVPFVLTNSGSAAAMFELQEMNEGWDVLTLHPAVQVPGHQVTWDAKSYAGRHLAARESWLYQPSRDVLLGTPVDVLLLAAADVTQIQAILQAYPDIKLVDYFDARQATPALAELLAYDTVIVIANFAFADPIAAGDVLADYVDAGGTVIQTVPTFYDPFGAGWGLQGRFVSDGYSPFIGTGDWFTWADLGAFDVSHPIMQAVTSAGDMLRQVVTLDTDAELVAEWTDDEFIATQDSVVALNTFLADGYTWTGDVDRIVHNSINWLNARGDAPWLFEDPITGTVIAQTGVQLVDVTFDAGVAEVTQPGQYYAKLRVKENTPYQLSSVPVTMTVKPPATWGKLTGSVRGLGYCDSDAAPLPGAQVLIEGSSGMTWTLNTGGGYSLWLDQGHSPLTMTVTHPGYQAGQVTGVVVTAQLTTTQDIDLRWLQPCVSLEPTALTATLRLGESTTRTVDIANRGAAVATFSLHEWDRGFLPPGPVGGRGEWLYESDTGIPMRSNQHDTALAYPSAYRWQPEQPLASMSVLIYADDAIHVPPNTLLDLALQNLGLAYTAHYSGDWAGFEADLVAGTWDLVLVGNDSWSPPASALTALNSYVSAGGKLVFHGWTVGFDPGNTLWTTLGFTWASDDNNPPDPVHWWDASHPIFTSPESVPEFTSLSSNIYNIYGQHVQPLAGFKALAGFTTPGPDPNEAAMIVGNDARTVFKGFLDGQNSANLDADALMDGVELWINLIDGIQGGFRADVPWLSESPITGTIAADVGTQSIDVIFDASVVTQTGEYYATLQTNSSDPVNQRIGIPVTMTAKPPVTWGKLHGSALGLGYCDADAAPLPGAQVLIEGSSGLTWTLTAGSNGGYSVWLDQNHSPLTVTVTFPEHQMGQASGVTVSGQMTTTQDLNLRWLQPCIKVEPTALSATLRMGETAAQTLKITNSGALVSEFAIREVGQGLVLAQPQAVEPLHIAGQIHLPHEGKASTLGTSSDDLALLASGGPDPFGYTLKDSNEVEGPVFQWIEIAPPAGGSGTAIGLSGVDDGYFWPLSLPFTFKFYGKDYTKLAVASNGTLYFEGRYLGYHNTSIPGATSDGVDTFIAHYWDDLVLDPGEVYYLAQEDVVIIEYYQVRGYGYSFDHGTWQVILFENGNILFQYRDATVGAFRDYGVSATIGIQGDAGTGLQYAHNAAVLADQLAICFAYPGGSPDCSLTDVPWLLEDPVTGTLGADGGMQFIDVTFDAGQVAGLGEYYVTLNLRSDDPLSGSMAIPVALKVQAAGQSAYLPLILKDSP